jgi:phosphomannomutase/phosphoglucomutase
MKPINQEIFRAYDIRGVVDQDFDAEWVETLGKACGAYFKEKGHDQAVVGHDARHSSPEYQERMVKGLTSAGVDVVYLDQVPTPTFYYACKKLGRQAGVMITASHNPPEFNGFKVWEGESTIHSEEIQRIYQIMVTGDFPTGSGVATHHDIVPTYIDELASMVSLKNPVKLVLDGGNGTGGEITAEILRRVGAEVICQYCEPDGDFPNHHPDPTIEKYMVDLQKRVQEEGAQAGIGLDGDDDRIGVVDENGRLLYGDELVAIFARHILKKTPGETIIGDVKCTHLMYKDIANHGGNPIMWSTGHSLIKAKMRQEGSRFSGEMSGHLFFGDPYYGFDDATYAAVKFAEIVDENWGTPVSQFLADWPKTYSTPEIRMECSEGSKFAIVKRAQEYFKEQGYEVIDIDGVRITFPDGWGLLRASNTQPTFVMRFEAESEERLAEIRKIIEEPLARWIEEMA